MSERERLELENFHFWVKSNKIFGFLSMLYFSYVLLFMTPLLFPKWQSHLINEDDDKNSDHGDAVHWWFYQQVLSKSLLDMAWGSLILFLMMLYSAFDSYSLKNPQYQNLDSTNLNEFKSREELEEEALEEPIFSHTLRFIQRPAFPTEIAASLLSMLSIAKCLFRLQYEIHTLDEAQGHHPVFWISCLVCAIYTALVGFYFDSFCQRLSMLYQARDMASHDHHSSIHHTHPMDDLEEHVEQTILMTEPLLSAHHHNSLENHPVVSSSSSSSSVEVLPSEDSRNPKYKANFQDLIQICYPDLPYFGFAFIFLILAAVAQVLIPRYTGNMLDAIAHYAAQQNRTQTFLYEYSYEDHANNPHHHDDDIWSVTDFGINMKKLVLVSILGGIFAGIRGSIFTVVGARVNVRIRTLLMDSLLAQDIGFFDVTKTGDITSRLSSDTTLVGDQVTLNVNVFLRSFVQAVGVLIFMTMLSWQLTLLAFISVPVITMFSKWYGHYIRTLTKLMQKKLAEGNSISEAALSSMSTVRALGAEHTEMKEFNLCMDRYLYLNMKSAVAYFGYAAAVTSLPQLVTAVVLFYGGLLVMADGNDSITAGQLVSFLLYLSSLSDAFNSIGSIFASLTQAVGAADKVFELIHREPKRKRPSVSDGGGNTTQNLNTTQNSLFLPSCQVTKFRSDGVSPITCSGEVTFDKVIMSYPSRPARRILDEMSLYIPPGSVAALVGASGGGKSSVISLIQNLYDCSSGDVYIDGIKVHDLCPQWLSNNVAVVSQEPTLFARSIRRNIIYGLEGTDQEPSFQEIQDAARLANAASFIESLPQQYETDVGERGVQLSGGQKQRIAIARALVRKPKILLLDEATSALDAESEAMVQEAIDNMISRDRKKDTESPSMTVIIVAHRLSTVRNADIIFVVDKGKVVESGSHDQLIRETDGAYLRLVSRQMKAENKLIEVALL